MFHRFLSSEAEKPLNKCTHAIMRLRDEPKERLRGSRFLGGALRDILKNSCEGDYICTCTHVAQVNKLSFFFGDYLLKV